MQWKLQGHLHTHTHKHSHAHTRTQKNTQWCTNTSSCKHIYQLKNAETQGQIYSLTDNSALTRSRTHILITHMHTNASACTPIEKHVSMSSRFNKPPNAHPHLWHSSTRRLTLQCHNVAQVWTNTSMNLALNYATSCTHRHTHTQAHTLQHTRAICAYTQTWKKLELDQWNKERFQQKHVDHKFLTSREKPTILVLHTQPRMCMNIHTQIHT